MMFFALHAGYYSQGIEIFIGRWYPNLLNLHIGDIVGVWW